MRKYLNLFDFTQEVDYKTEVLSGLTVAMALIPEAVAFALIAGLSPLPGVVLELIELRHKYDNGQPVDKTHNHRRGHQPHEFTQPGNPGAHLQQSG